MEIRKTINISLKDYFFFNLGLIKKNIFTYILILAVICVAFVAIMFDGFAFNSLDFWLKYLMFYGIGIAFLCLYFGLLTFIASRRAYLPNKKYYQNMEMVINEKGIFQYSEGAESGFTYDKIFKVKENIIAFIVLISPRQGILIPKKAFTKEEEAIIRNLVKK